MLEVIILKDKTVKNIYIVLIVIIALLSFFAMNGSFLRGCNDAYFYEGRILSLAQNIQHGEWLPSLQSDNLYGIGYLVDVFYPSLIIYPLAILNICGVSATMLISITVAIISIITSYTSLKAGKLFFSGNNIKYAYLFSILYVFSPARLMHVLECVLISSQIAIALFPLIICNLVELVRNKKWIPLAVSMTILAYVHLFSLLSVSIFAFLYVCFYKYKEIKKDPQIIVGFIKAGAISLGAFLAFLLPFLENITYDEYLSMYKLIGTKNIYFSPIKIIIEIIFNIGIIFIVVLLKKKIKDRFLCKISQISICLIVISAHLFPVSLTTLIDVGLTLQMGTRFDVYTAFFTSLTLVKLILLNQKKIKDFALNVITCFSIFSLSLFIYTIYSTNVDWHDYNKGNTYLAVCGGEYLNKEYITSNNVDYIKIAAKNKYFEDYDIEIVIPDITKIKTSQGNVIDGIKGWQSLSFSQNSSEPVDITTELLYYKNYVATLNGEPIPISKIDGKVGLKNVGAGNIVIKYQVSPIQKISAIISVNIAIIFLIYVFAKKKQKVA